MLNTAEHLRKIKKYWIIQGLHWKDYVSWLTMLKTNQTISHFSVETTTDLLWPNRNSVRRRSLTSVLSKHNADKKQVPNDDCTIAPVWDK